MSAPPKMVKKNFKMYFPLKISPETIRRTACLSNQKTGKNKLECNRPSDHQSIHPADRLSYDCHYAYPTVSSIILLI